MKPPPGGGGYINLHFSIGLVLCVKHAGEEGAGGGRCPRLEGS